jgi:hypothetical protein
MIGATGMELGGSPSAAIPSAVASQICANPIQPVPSPSVVATDMSQPIYIICESTLQGYMDLPDPSKGKK